MANVLLQRRTSLETEKLSEFDSAPRKLIAAFQEHASHARIIAPSYIEEEERKSPKDSPDPAKSSEGFMKIKKTPWSLAAPAPGSKLIHCVVHEESRQFAGVYSNGLLLLKYYQAGGNKDEVLPAIKEKKVPLQHVSSSSKLFWSAQGDILLHCTSQGELQILQKKKSAMVVQRVVSLPQKLPVASLVWLDKDSVLVGLQGFPFAIQVSVKKPPKTSDAAKKGAPEFRLIGVFNGAIEHMVALSDSTVFAADSIGFYYMINWKMGIFERVGDSTMKESASFLQFSKNKSLLMVITRSQMLKVFKPMGSSLKLICAHPAKEASGAIFLAGTQVGFLASGDHSSFSILNFFSGKASFASQVSSRPHSKFTCTSGGRDFFLSDQTGLTSHYTLI